LTKAKKNHDFQPCFVGVQQNQPAHVLTLSFSSTPQLYKAFHPKITIGGEFLKMKKRFGA
jgi:Tfp pilus assembly protein PilZ